MRAILLLAVLAAPATAASLQDSAPPTFFYSIEHTTAGVRVTLDGAPNPQPEGYSETRRLTIVREVGTGLCVEVIYQRDEGYSLDQKSPQIHYTDLASQERAVWLFVREVNLVDKSITYRQGEPFGQAHEERGILRSVLLDVRSPLTDKFFHAPCWDYVHWHEDQWRVGCWNREWKP